MPKGERKVREPTPEELSKFTSIADILSWAKIPGVATWRGSAAGRLLDLLGCADAGDGLVDISEFASIEPETLDDAVTKWTFSKFKSPEAFTDHTSKAADEFESDNDLTEAPKAMDVARAKIAHNATRLATGIVWSREARTDVELTAAGLVYNEDTNLFELGHTSTAAAPSADSPAA